MAAIVVGFALLPLFILVAGALGEDSIVASCLVSSFAFKDLC
jgi:hypothetical protein